jgi:tetratricopeptide (TPR) repeat protein
LIAPQGNGWYCRGAIKQKSGDSEGAIKDLDKMLKLNPGYNPALFFRGLAKRDKGDKEGARADLEKFVKNAPRSSFNKAAKEALAKLDEP